MIDTASQQTTCLACGSPIIQIGGRGHRKKLYCDDTCRQRGHRKHQARQESQEQEVLRDRIAALEIELQRLQECLNVEERYRTDTQVRHFKSWLRKRQLPQDAGFLKVFLEDTRVPHHASRSMYISRLKQYGYTAEDITVFEEIWKDMLFSQS